MLSAVPDRRVRAHGHSGRAQRHAEHGQIMDGGAAEVDLQDGVPKPMVIMGRSVGRGNHV